MNTLQRIFVMLFLVNAGTSPVWADNAVYIDQVGSGADIDITQDGSGNKIGANANDDTKMKVDGDDIAISCLLYTSPSPRDKRQSRMPSSA